jgi:regulator of sigma E protease
VFVHELGHFFAARMFGVHAKVFSIGFGPALLKWIDQHGTVWKISIVPLGGYVQLHGQEHIFDRNKYSSLTAKDKKGHYLSVSAWKQAVIIAAGVIMNFLLAFAIYTAMFASRPQAIQPAVVGAIAESSAALEAGVHVGDTILRVNEKKIESWPDMLLAKELATGHESELVLLRGEKLVQVKINADKWGIAPDMSKVEIHRMSLWRAPIAAVAETYTQSKTLIVVLKQIITGDRSSKQLGSFISIAEVSGKAMAAGAFALLAIIALLSVNLAVINLLPLPVLDGGYLLILAIEGAIRKKLQGKAMEYVLVAGWIFIGLLFALTMKNDIFRVFGWN